MDKSKIESRVISGARGLRENAQLAKNAESNWYVLYGEPLPAGEASA